MDAEPRRRTRSFLLTSRETLGGYMRDVVLEGTGRSLQIESRCHCREDRNRGGDRRAVAFLVHRLCAVRAATRRVAVAVILENAGYGGAGAAPAAGEIIDAAAALGWRSEVTVITKSAEG